MDRAQEGWGAKKGTQGTVNKVNQLNINKVKY